MRVSTLCSAVLAVTLLNGCHCGPASLPAISINDVSLQEGNSGTTAFVFTVSLDAAPAAGQDVQVSWATVDGTAHVGSDYAAGSGTLTFTSGGALSQTISISVTGDTAREPDETFTVVLSDPQNATLARVTGVGTIVADDFPSLSISDASAAEGATLSFQVTLSLAPAPGQDVQVSWATSDGTATAGSDYTAASGTLTFTSAGPLTQTITVDATQDSTPEPNETLLVTLSNPVNTAVGTATAAGTIIDDDSGTPSVSVSGVTADEGTPPFTSNFSFTVTLSGPLPAGVTGTVAYATADGTATAGSDYTAASGTLTFTSGGSLTQTVRVTVKADAQEEPDETFFLNLSSPANLILGTSVATGTILSDDVPVASISDAQVVEGNSGTTNAVFTVKLSSDPLSTHDAQLDWAANVGSAVMPTDFPVGTSGTLTFVHGGSLTQTISVPVIGDTLVEGDEIFLVRFYSQIYVKSDGNVGVGTIIDDDQPALSITDVTQLEGSSGTTPLHFTVSVYPAPAPGKDVQVSWATSPRTASPPADYTAASGTLTFTSAGPLTQTVTVDVAGDTAAETNEELAVVLSGAVNARIHDGIGIGTIVDDDGAVIRVDPTGSGTNGLTWATAYQTIQAGVDRAQALGGGQVWVAAGRYTNGANPVLTMAGNVSVIGGFDGWRGGAGTQETTYSARRPDLYVPVMDGNKLTYHVVVGASNAVLDGFKVTNGNANGGVNPGDPQRRGGGMDNGSASPLVVRTVFIDNAAQGYGGAMYNGGGAPYVRDCRFLRNSAVEQGGAIYDSGSSAQVLDSVFSANSASISNVNSQGGAVAGQNQSSAYTSCRFVANAAHSGAGGASTSGNLTFRGCDFVGNQSSGTGGGLSDISGNDRVYDSNIIGNSASGNGGGLYSRDSSTWVVNSRIENNAALSGGGVYDSNALGGVQRFTRVRIANNRAGNGGGATNFLSSPAFADTIFEGNTASSLAGGVYNQGSSPTFSSCTLMNDASPSTPEIHNEPYMFTPRTASNPVAVNTIVWNRTIGIASIWTDPSCTASAYPPAGCSFTTSFMSTTDASQDAQLMHVPVRSNQAASGTTTTLSITNASTFFAVGDVVEIADDGVARTVTAATTSQLTYSPALGVAPPSNARVDDWGPGATDLAVDLRLQATSPCIDSGDGAQVAPDVTDLDGDGDTAEPLPYDFAGDPRFAGAVDLGALERGP
ncbi:MAG TPA: Calx-beta domain-containing protein [Myxococcaceae bacterium]|nr:Calx-beta domain-containing protein [Myxococcaceae bacterium]